MRFGLLLLISSATLLGLAFATVANPPNGPISGKIPPEQAHPATPGTLPFPGIPKHSVPNMEAWIRSPAKNEKQYAMLMPNGRFFGQQMFLKKDPGPHQIMDLERFLEIVAFAHEEAEWGANGPPGGFSIPDNRHPKRRKRDIKQQYTSEDIEEALVALASIQNEMEAAADDVKEVKKRDVDQKLPAMKIGGLLKDNLVGNRVRREDAAKMPESFTDYIKLVWTGWKRVFTEGFPGIDRLARELHEDLERHRLNETEIAKAVAKVKRQSEDATSAPSFAEGFIPNLPKGIINEEARRKTKEMVDEVLKGIKKDEEKETDAMKNFVATMRAKRELEEGEKIAKKLFKPEALKKLQDKLIDLKAIEKPKRETEQMAHIPKSFSDYLKFTWNMWKRIGKNGFSAIGDIVSEIEQDVKEEKRKAVLEKVASFTEKLEKRVKQKHGKSMDHVLEELAHDILKDSGDEEKKREKRTPILKIPKIDLDSLSHMNHGFAEIVFDKVAAEKLLESQRKKREAMKDDGVKDGKKEAVRVVGTFAFVPKETKKEDLQAAFTEAMEARRKKRSIRNIFSERVAAGLRV